MTRRNRSAIARPRRFQADSVSRPQRCADTGPGKYRPRLLSSAELQRRSATRPRPVASTARQSLGIRASELFDIRVHVRRGPRAPARRRKPRPAVSRRRSGADKPSLDRHPASTRTSTPAAAVRARSRPRRAGKGSPPATAVCSDIPGRLRSVAASSTSSPIRVRGSRTSRAFDTSPQALRDTARIRVEYGGRAHLAWHERAALVEQARHRLHVLTSTPRHGDTEVRFA